MATAVATALTGGQDQVKQPVLVSLPGIPTESRSVGKLEDYTQRVIYKARKLFDAGFILLHNGNRSVLYKGEVGLLASGDDDLASVKLGQLYQIEGYPVTSDVDSWLVARGSQGVSRTVQNPTH